VRRLLVLIPLAALVAASPARAAAPCWKRVVKDWYADGRIATTYPKHCYSSAYSHLHTDELIYTDLGDSIRNALAASVARRAGRHVPTQVGKPAKARTSQPQSARPSKSERHRVAAGPAPQQAIRVIPSARASSSSPPLALILLGSLALALIGAGGIGALVRRSRRAS
jgi:hypothetical protein